MKCIGCPNRYAGKGWICWSGNKKSLRKCDNGKPLNGRVIYRGKEVRRESPVEEEHGNS